MYQGVTNSFATIYNPCGPYTVRLACLTHAASVHPEPESNSLKRIKLVKYIKLGKFTGGYTRSLISFALGIRKNWLEILSLAGLNNITTISRSAPDIALAFGKHGTSPKGTDAQCVSVQPRHWDDQSWLYNQLV